MGELRETLAEYAHNAWSGWMQYMFSKCAYDRQDRTRTVPDWAVKRWTRQANTPYVDLPEGEKESDRDEADKIIGLIDGRIAKLEEENERLKDEGILLKSALAAIVDIVSNAQREKSIQDHIANAIRTMSDPLDCDSEES